jgi:hypothetical protein
LFSSGGGSGSFDGLDLLSQSRRLYLSHPTNSRQGYFGIIPNRRNYFIPFVDNHQNDDGTHLTSLDWLKI